MMLDLLPGRKLVDLRAYAEHHPDSCADTLYSCDGLITHGSANVFQRLFESPIALTYMAI
ncbi:hypothetical protein KCTCHS21_32290 [Cohnella abietis]|uniref:Uncharacterized protein n=1 Tax=Cohnella abietis TaxID=2507935 RepID=A0A3T1D6W3_9BACL|nr:hypothetical protein [Cohnella abietis]BBI33830.1 hypothetical protein KCTCHS21_32290 [Cohnella abietis]